MKLDVVVGAQFGSEAKGHVTQRLIERFQYDWHDFIKGDEDREPRILNVRVAGPNAGHTAHDVDGQPVAFRQLPVGAVIPGVAVAIAAGSEVDLAVLSAEIEIARKRGIGDFRLYVDPMATILSSLHVDQEVGMHERTGSTGKGIGAARAERVMRVAATIRDSSYAQEVLEMKGALNSNVAALAQSGFWDYVVVEGTQGYGLGLHTSFYPLTTSSDCRAIDFLAMAGINPWCFEGVDFTVWAVARVFPIRVAGPSGPLLNETTWEALGLPEERTTVTKKVRRVGAWDRELVADAVRYNGGAPTVKLAITMLDQLFPATRDVRETHRLVVNRDVMGWLDKVSKESRASVRLVTTGPNTGVFL